MNIQAITKTAFAHKYWRRSQGYSFAAQDSICALTLSELPQAALNLPVAFVQNTEHFELVAVQGLQPAMNFFVNAKGQWLGKYIPASYRTYPFMLVPNDANKEQLVLCIDEDCGLITEEKTDDLFYDETGELSATLIKIMDYLTSISSSRAVATRICDVLDKHRLIKPWELQLELNSGVQQVNGLFCIDEEALNSLPDQALIEVRTCGALPVIYCQLLSMQHMSALIKFAQSRAKPSKELAIDELNFGSMSSDGIISFDNL